ncbi:OLC1v1019001C1 [Oldenlandia corymbosa var. corymbosa]|uniref:OLC1v1019001C1 n=1 Tax=Oldenlandia corymbosa var. corymbosa TaxID=529605 RepID=A0AAV1ECY2_OLDCO|nr:OLC1v1019001C1 [Oldenlandia corymbosa var. corymbosa]
MTVAISDLALTPGTAGLSIVSSSPAAPAVLKRKRMFPLAGEEKVEAGKVGQNLLDEFDKDKRILIPAIDGGAGIDAAVLSALRKQNPWKEVAAAKLARRTSPRWFRYSINTYCILTQIRMGWKIRIDDTLSEQQSLTSELRGIFSQWKGHPAGLSGRIGASTHYHLSWMIPNLDDVNGMVHDDARVEEDNQDQFIVDA